MWHNRQLDGIKRSLAHPSDGFPGPCIWHNNLSDPVQCMLRMCCLRTLGATQITHLGALVWVIAATCHSAMTTHWDSMMDSTMVYLFFLILQPGRAGRICSDSSPMCGHGQHTPPRPPGARGACLRSLHPDRQPALPGQAPDRPQHSPTPRAAPGLPGTPTLLWLPGMQYHVHVDDILPCRVGCLIRYSRK